MPLLGFHKVRLLVAVFHNCDDIFVGYTQRTWYVTIQNSNKLNGSQQQPAWLFYLNRVGWL